MVYKVVIVGAGPAGLITMTNFQRIFKPEELEMVCYERRGQLGGEWIDMKDQPETYDKLGLPLRTNIYDELQMNSPQLIYPPHPDYKFPPGTKLFPTRQQMYNYLKMIADDNKLEKYIKFNQMVSDISFDKETSKFSMKVHDLKGEDVSEETCDYLLLCNGRYGYPRKPDVDMSKFTGEWFHYHDLRDPKRMYGKRILVVGSSWAGMDMLILLNRPGRAKSMHICWKNHSPIFLAGANVASVHEWISSAEGNTVHFKDGTSVEVDSVIFCNGFTPFYPLVDDLQLDFEMNHLSRFLPPLYKHFVHPKCPKLLFIGKPHVGGLYVPHPQSILISKIIKGEFTLPSQEEMEKDIEEFRLKWEPELDLIQTEEEKDTYYGLCDMEAVIGDWYHDMCPDVPRTNECLREIYYDGLLWGIRKDCLNYKNWVHEYRPDPKDPKRMVPHFFPAPSN